MNGIRNRQSDNKTAYYVITIVSFLILLQPIARIIKLTANVPTASIILNGYNELRDYVSFRLAHFAVEGINPYTVSFLEQTNVPFIPLYPGLNPLLVAIICRFTGFSIMAGFYIVNLFMLSVTAFNMWLIIKEFIRNRFIGILCTVINVSTFFCLFCSPLGAPIFNFHTDTIGICCTSFLLLVAYKKRENTLLLAILSVLLVFTKQILLIMVLPLFIWYLIINRKLALKYFLESVVTGIVSFISVQLLFPLYWTETIYMQFSVSANYGTIIDALKNIGDFYYKYYMFPVLIVLGIIGMFIFRKKAGKETKLTAVIRSLTHEESFILYLILNIVIGTAVLLYLAKCQEDGYKYCQDILSPSLFLLLIFVWNKCFAGSITAEGKAKVYWEAAVLIALCVATTITYSHYRASYYLRNDYAAYLELDSAISEHEGGNMYLGMNSTQYLLNRDIWEADNIWFNDGQIEYFVGDMYNNPVADRLFYSEEISVAANDYVDQVNSMIGNREFCLVATCRDEIIDMDLLEANYYVSGVYWIKTDTNGSCEVKVWLPVGQ